MKAHEWKAQLSNKAEARVQQTKSSQIALNVSTGPRLGSTR